jgi:hypothetical protein
MQFRRLATGGEAKAIPSRIPARPKALERVCKTIRFGYAGTDEHKEELEEEKSIYASSRTRSPFQKDRVRERRL